MLLRNKILSQYVDCDDQAANINARSRPICEMPEPLDGGLLYFGESGPHIETSTHSFKLILKNSVNENRSN